MKHTLEIRKKYYADLRRELESHGQPIRLPESNRAFSAHRIQWRDGTPVVAHVFADVRIVPPRDERGVGMREQARAVRRALRTLRRELRPSEAAKTLALVIALPNQFDEVNEDGLAEMVRNAKKARPAYDVLVVYGVPAHRADPAKKARALGLAEAQVLALCDDFRTVEEAVDHLVRQAWHVA